MTPPLTRLQLFVPLLLGLFLARGVAGAQSLEVAARMPHSAFILHEPAPLLLTLRNLGGSPFILDDYGEHRNNTVRIHLKSQEDGFLRTLAERPFSDVMVMPGEAEEVQADLLQIFPLAKPGRYHVQAVVNRGSEVVATRQIMFDIVTGMEIGSTSRPLPDYDTVFRRYTLLYWPRDQMEILFLRIDETPPGRCVAMLQLGNIVRIATPRIQFSPDGSTLTVVHQSSPDLFIQTTIRTDRDEIRVLDRQRLLDPNQSPMARALLQQDRGASPHGEAAEEDGGFKRRQRLRNN